MTEIALSPTSGLLIAKPPATVSNEHNCESAACDFKGEFDPADKGHWCELIKDFVALANTGGGKLLIGVGDDGIPTGFNCSSILETDIALFVDQLHKYTDMHFAKISVRAVQLAGFEIAEVEVGSAASLLVFNQAGNYLRENGKQKNAFVQGAVYVRHGPKSEPATSEDIRAFIEKKIQVEREEILINLRKVVEAPVGAVVSVGPPRETAPAGSLDRVRLVTDPHAPGVVLMDPNTTHPYRLREVVSEVIQRLGDETCISVHDILGIRRLYQTNSNQAYYYKPKTGSGQYSEALIQWILDQIKADHDFLVKLRERHHEWVLQQNSQRRKAATLPPGEWRYSRSSGT